PWADHGRPLPLHADVQPLRAGGVPRLRTVAGDVADPPSAAALPSLRGRWVRPRPAAAAVRSRRWRRRRGVSPDSRNDLVCGESEYKLSSSHGGTGAVRDDREPWTELGREMRR